MPKVNLVPKEERAREFRRQLYVVPLACGIVIVAALAGSYYYYSNQLSSAEDQLQNIRASIASLQPKVDELDSYQEIKNKKQQQLSTVNTIYNQRVRWSRTFDDLSFVIPDDVWLVSINASTPAGATTGAAGAGQTQAGGAGQTAAHDVEIEGYTYEMSSVATFIIRLGLIPSLTDVTLESAEKVTLGDRTVTNFKIGASLKKAGAAQAPSVSPTTGGAGTSPMTTPTGTSTAPTGTSTTPTGTTARTTGTTR